jgi:putative sterol carrier protein
VTRQRRPHPVPLALEQNAQRLQHIILIISNQDSVHQLTDEPRLQVQEGKITGKKGRAERPHVTLQASATDWLDITSGKVDSLVAFFLGKLKVSGNLILARRLREILPSATAQQ